MNKIIKFTILLTSFFVVAMCIYNMFINFTQNGVTSIQELKQKSDYCLLVSTFTTKTTGMCGNTDQSITWPPNVTTIKKNGKYYIEVFIHSRGEQPIKDHIITIIQENKAYIKAERQYLLFLKKNETEDNCYYIVDEPNGIIEITKTKLKPINKKMKKIIKTEIGKNYDDYADWFMENYDDIRNYEFPLSITDIGERSNFCITASAINNKDAKTKKIGNLYYTTVKVMQKSSDNIPDYITVVQKNEPYIKKDYRYILFLKSSETDENYYITDEQNGVIIIENGEKQTLKALNKDLQECVEKEIGTDYQEFCIWLERTYGVHIS